MKLKSVSLSIILRKPTLLLTLMMSLPLCCYVSDFLKVNETYIKDNYGVGIDVYLYGTNLGGWRGYELWMSPLVGASNEWDARNILTEGFW